jgi:catechol 2,3-dioxygenase-like lactoylglutathione lyase family enzyme
MPRIVHIAIKVDDLDKATKFYEGRLRLSPKPAQDMHVGMSQDTSQTETSTWP